VLGKGNKERIIYLNEACRTALQDYLTIRKSEKYQTCYDRALFVTNRMARISIQGVQVTVQKYLKLAGLESKHYSVHKLRHTAATLMYQSGAVDIRVLKDILGHEQLNTTQIYTHVSDRSMEEAMRHNPLSGERPEDFPVAEADEYGEVLWDDDPDDDPDYDPDDGELDPDDPDDDDRNNAPDGGEDGH
jgi:hypothetical protein